MISTPITLSNIDSGEDWGAVLFNDDETNGTITYKIYYDASGTPTIIPDSDLSGNSTGFGTSPIDLTDISISDYPIIYLYAVFEDNTGSPYLYDWAVVPDLTPTYTCVIEESPTDAENIFTWQEDEDDEDGIEVQRMDNNSSTWNSLQSLASSITTYTDTTISQGNEYDYRVATFYSNTSKSYSDWCYTVEFSIRSGNFQFEGLKMEGLDIN